MLPTDAEDMYEYAQEPLVTNFLLWEPHVSIKFTQSYLKFIQTQYSAGCFFDWSLVLADSGKMIGTCGFTCFDFDNDSAEVGYVLNPDYRGHEIIPEALHAVMKFGFENLLLNRIEAHYIVGNDASRRVMEKVGMRFEGVRRCGMLIKGQYRDIGVCAVLSEEFR